MCEERCACVSPLSDLPFSYGLKEKFREKKAFFFSSACMCLGGLVEGYRIHSFRTTRMITRRLFFFITTIIICSLTVSSKLRPLPLPPPLKREEAWA